MKRVRRKQTKNQRRETRCKIQQAIALDDGTLSTPASVAMIQALIPLGLQAVEEALLAEVQALAGPRYSRDDAQPDLVRWGAQRGSIYLADQKLQISVPRVRDRREVREIPLATYAALQTPRAQDAGLFRRVLGRLSCREYESAAEAVPEAFGLARSSVSRRFIRASAGELRRLLERRLDDREWLVLVLDGKTFAGDQLVVALGVTTTGEKRILGLVQTASENKRVITQFLRELEERGFPLDQQILVVLDGAKGLRAAVSDVLGDVPVQRCQWHKRENVVSYLAKQDQSAHAPSSRCVPRTRREFQDDESDRKRHGPARSDDTPRDALAHERSEAALVRVRSLGDRAAIPPGKESSSSTLAPAGTAEQTVKHEIRRGVSRIISGITGISTRKGTFPPLDLGF
jgi:putative transposase